MTKCDIGSIHLLRNRSVEHEKYCLHDECRCLLLQLPSSLVWRTAKKVHRKKYCIAPRDTVHILRSVLDVPSYPSSIRLWPVASPSLILDKVALSHFFTQPETSVAQRFYFGLQFPLTSGETPRGSTHGLKRWFLPSDSM
jgi:hypothetical protein